jgi:hypothetical protein
MKKSIKTLIACIAIVACGSILTRAATFYPLSVQEAAVNGGANYGTSISAADFVGYSTATNVAITTNGTGAKIFAPIQAYSTVKIVGARLVKPFTSSTASINTNYTQTLTLSVGDGTSGTKYINAWNISTSATYMALGPIETSTPTLATLVGTNFTGIVVTNLTIATTVGGTTSYTAATNLPFVFTQNVNEQVTTNTTGELVIYWRIYK